MHFYTELQKYNLYIQKIIKQCKKDYKLKTIVSNTYFIYNNLQARVKILFKYCHTFQSRKKGRRAFIRCDKLIMDGNVADKTIILKNIKYSSKI